jgi:two-component system CheB/CheR fusion protein
MARKKASKPERSKPATPDNSGIVGIGGSAGGVRALQTLFDNLPPDAGLTYVVILHLAPDMRSELPSVLRSHTTMPVTTVDGPTPLETDHVYVISPDRVLSISDHHISSDPFQEERGRRLPIDLFFRSLAAHRGDSFAVVLSGAGADGALGVRAVKDAGGIVLVQEPREAEHASMPNAAIKTGAADIVLPVGEIGRRLAELAQPLPLSAEGKLKEDEEDLIRRILAQVRVGTGHDFSKYKRSTVLRRIQRRAQVARKERLADYFAFLRDDPEEARALFADLLISVTSFFRDPDAFEALATKVIPKLFDGKGADDQIRVWVPGCATGEEAYTLGMLLLEEASRREAPPELQVFGSDLDPNALTTAREGRYPAAIEADVSEDRLRRYFIRDHEQYQVKRELRDIVLFASHSLLRDPPFSRIDLISCRNLLIYLERDLQHLVIATFHYALNPNGFLFLGASETAEHPGAYFQTVDREGHVYQGVAGGRDKDPNIPRLLGIPSPRQPAPVARAPAPTRPSVESATHREALEKTGPPSMLVDEAHHAVHLSETAGRFLQPSGGALSADIIELARPELRLDLRAALYRAFERNEPTLSPPIRVRFNGAAHRVYLQVRPLWPGEQGGPRRALVCFIEGEAVDDVLESSTAADDRAAGETVRRLAEELRLTQARLRLTSEEAEGTNEELRAANEELQSINEEYRSTSEELETSKEELQSVNEELQTVNNELKLKLEGVSRANSDLQNLMAATDVGTLFLDTALRIKRFTPRLTDFYNITARDEGRPVTDFTHRLDYDRLRQDATAVLRKLTPIEREVSSHEGEWFLMRMRPYRTLDDHIDGVVVTFVDITERRKAELALRHSEERLRQEMRLVELSHSPIFIWDLKGGVVQWNRGSEQLYGYPRDQIIGQKKNQLLKTEVPGSSFEALTDQLVRTGRWSGELHQTTRDGRRLIVEAELELVEVGDQRLVFESSHDITERKSWEKRQELMVAELSHRVKNTLAVVQSMASQSIRGANSAEEFTERFEGRLVALARAHRLLTDPWKGADLHALANEQLEPYANGKEGRLRLEGGSFNLPADVAVPLGLILHELATNAVKHGAWSAPKGLVILSWSLGRRNPSTVLSLVWREQGGPPVERPKTRGFGAQLIERGAPNSKVRSEFNPDGLVCTIELPIPEDAG